MIESKSPHWNRAVFKKGKEYHCYAIHTNGKVEKAGISKELSSAALKADELTCMLNKHHKYAGKYAGTDIIVGKEVDPNQIAQIVKRFADALKIYIIEHKKIFSAKNKGKL